MVTAGLIAIAASGVAAAQEVPAAIELALEKASAEVQRIVDVPSSRRTFDNTVNAIDDVVAHVELGTNMIQFMAYVSTDADERQAGQAAEEAVTNWFIELAKNEDLFNAVTEFSRSSPRLDADQQRLLDHTLRDFRRAGMALDADTRGELKEVQKKVTKLSIDFERNIREDETVVPLTKAELAGVPADFFEQFDDEQQVGDVVLVGMSYPMFLPIMDYCHDEVTRKKVWVAYKRRGGQKNVRVLEQILELRAQAAQLLGYAHPADYETEVRMSKNADNVMAFYRRLRPLVRAKAERDFEEFLAAKRKHTGDRQARLYPWDQSYYQNKLKKDKYNVDSQKVRAYFPLDAAMDGLFSITQSLYGLEYRDVTERARGEGRRLWHEDVKLYEVWDNASGDLLGEFYLDLHPRANKYGHAAQWGLAQHKVWTNGHVTRPLAALVCNFSAPTADAPALMTHDEVETFFHEFGHCLHTILSEARYWQQSGTNVERDFVEAPSQMFENWVWDADVLATFTRHYKTGQKFPSDLLASMIRARNLGSGMLAEHQFYYGLVDMAYHTDPEGDVDTTGVGIDLFCEIELYDRIPGTHFQAAFGHLTGYQAGYYGYQWSLVYACDMFERFKELGMLDPSAGQHYRNTILSRGGTKDGLDLVRDYLGREPDMSAYLEHLGLESDGSTERRSDAGR
jgi:thimet oligopeptidase